MKCHDLQLLYFLFYVACPGMDVAFAEPFVLVASSPTLVNGPAPHLKNRTISGLQNALPSNIMLVTLKPLPRPLY